ncbi:Retrovirus-related Pol polyprotein from transposon TNT 1-94 [Cucumis melo var. makuwa]|uniref:Retrovirus-related Pol polyprotein from transposon TNT 1-94 n=1 Tax=Cucumis melo var. makuwa TaxID=1194695 RepID=A0A5D3BU92_CUCMM|nr:Retrovirus-related Pol polyprotein from transposon TNT 1-94 [Cucumis melo var. makuwa]TYK02372.1 Retrovirus-related Pol polyprotein from transposon TNT 1-94 [Cucumis melo var. makuwa]
MFLEGRHQFDFLTGETVRPPLGDALERLWKGEDSLIRHDKRFVEYNSDHLLETTECLSVIDAAKTELNPKIDTVCGRILGQIPLPSVMEVCFEVHLEEDRTNAMGVLATPTIDPAAFNTWSSNHDNDKNNGKPIPVCEHCKKQWHTKDQCWKLHGRPQKTKTLTLGVIAQLGIAQSLGLIRIDGKNLWILDSGATDHLTSSSKHFISYALKITRELHCKVIFLLESIYFQDMNSERTIEATRNSRGLYILDDDTSCSSFSRNHINLHNHLTLIHSDVWGPSKVTPHRESGGSHLVEVARSLMLSTSLPSYLWGDAILTTAHLINRMPSRILHLHTPLNCLKKYYPSTCLVSEVPLRLFGCIAYVQILALIKPNLPLKLRLVCLLGIPFTNTVINIFTRRLGNTVTMDVTFNENRPYFPVSHLQGENEESQKGSWVPPSQSSAPVQDFEPPRDQGTRFYTKHPIYNYVFYDNLSLQFIAFTASLDSTIIPKNIYTALECPEWKNVVMKEMEALEKNRTWEICALLKGHKTVGCKWVFSLKYKADGMLDRHKARLVVKGFTQTYDFDYSETFSPVAKLNTVRVLLSVTMNKD